MMYMKHSQGQKVKGQGHKVMRRSSTKTSNIFSERHSVVDMHLSYRKSTLPERIAGSEAPIAVSGMRSENMHKTRL